ncbi:hypothetical protein ETD86_27110 [Nonomuraea turkmeniaca]|uniref:DUF6199 domain-containing protein n=1 Tax=Nonomuraea turkmeniaca TaxID=103838 RepID=A0A5S4FC88_9ACTN|nr:hypothetical protein [Nonomuraea turkmeniaca]TMR15451.1 hypothetical protein ETD86_27110 [Nonomuraea turkmeniaca]
MFTLIVIIAALAMLILAVAPKTPYLIQAAQYKNSEHHEPADWAVTFNRVVGIIGLVVFALFLPAAIERDQNPGTGQSTPQETEEKSEPTSSFTYIEEEPCDRSFPYTGKKCPFGEEE